MSLFSNLKRKAEEVASGVWRQVNPLDHGATYSNPNPRSQQQQAPQSQPQQQSQPYQQPSQPQYKNPFAVKPIQAPGLNLTQSKPVNLTVQSPKLTQPSYGSGIGGLFNHVKDAFDANTPQDQWKRNQQLQAPMAPNQTYAQQQATKGIDGGSIANNPLQRAGVIAKSFAKPVAQFANQGAMTVGSAVDTGKMLVGQATGNQIAANNASRNINYAHQYMDQQGHGLLGAGTPFKNAQEAQSGNLGTGLKRIGGNTLATMASVYAPGKGGTALLGAETGLKNALLTGAKTATVSGIGSAGGQIQQNDRIDPKQLAIDTAIGGALPVAGYGLNKGFNMAKPAVSNAINDVKGNIEFKQWAKNRTPEQINLARALKKGSSEPVDFGNLSDNKLQQLNAARSSNGELPVNSQVNVHPAVVQKLADKRVALDGLKPTTVADIAYSAVHNNDTQVLGSKYPHINALAKFKDGKANLGFVSGDTNNNISLKSVYAPQKPRDIMGALGYKKTPTKIAGVDDTRSFGSDNTIPNSTPKVNSLFTKLDQKGSIKNPLVNPDGTPRIGGTPVENTSLHPHQQAVVNQYADMLKSMDDGAKGGQLVNIADETSAGSYRRTSEHSKFYSDYYKQYGRKPSKAAFQEEALRQLQSGKGDKYAVQAFKDAGDPEVQALFNATDSGAMGKQPVGETFTVPTAPIAPVEKPLTQDQTIANALGMPSDQLAQAQADHASSLSMVNSDRQKIATSDPQLPKNIQPQTGQVQGELSQVPISFVCKICFI